MNGIEGWDGCTRGLRPLYKQEEQKSAVEASAKVQDLIPPLSPCQMVACKFHLIDIRIHHCDDTTDVGQCDLD